MSNRVYEGLIKDKAKIEAEKELNPTENPVESARLRCTACIEEESHVYVVKRHPYRIFFSNQKQWLHHKDTMIRSAFPSCLKTEDQKCSMNRIKIMGNQWYDYDEKVLIGGFALNKDNSYMICESGPGMLYISESGQSRGEMEREWSESFNKDGSKILTEWDMYEMLAEFMVDDLENSVLRVWAFVGLILDNQKNLYVIPKDIFHNISAMKWCYRHMKLCA